MTIHDWSFSISDPHSLCEVLGTPPPPLTEYELISFHIDEREASVALGFFAFGQPAGAVTAWQENGHNAVEFFLICTGVERLSVEGWSTEPFTSVSLSRSHVELSGMEKRISFDVAGIRADAPIGRLASRAP